MKRRTYIKKAPMPPSPEPLTREYQRHLKRYADRYIALVKEGLKEILPGLREELAAEIPDPQARIDVGDWVMNAGGAWSSKCRPMRIPRLDAEARMDANAEKAIEDLLAWVEAELKKAFPDATLKKWSRAAAAHVNRSEKDHMKKTAKAYDIEIGPMMHDRDLAPWVQNIVEENVGLIRSIAWSHQVALKNGLVAMVTSDSPIKQIREMLATNFGMTTRKAAFIARDQVGKLNGKINRYRQEQLGGKKYVWRTSKDERVRPDHQRLDGTVQSWGKPPIVDKRTGRRGHPGDDFQCRCRAEMVMDDLLD